MGTITSIFSRIFPCLSSSINSDPSKTTIKITSTSGCCRGSVQSISITDEHLEEFKEIVSGFIKKLEEEKK